MMRDPHDEDLDGGEMMRDPHDEGLMEVKW